MVERRMTKANTVILKIPFKGSLITFIDTKHDYDNWTGGPSNTPRCYCKSDLVSLITLLPLAVCLHRTSDENRFSLRDGVICTG